MGRIIPYIMENKSQVPNHQPDHSTIPFDRYDTGIYFVNFMYTSLSW